MKQLYSHLISLSFVLLFSAGAMQGMEAPQKDLAIEEESVIFEVPSLKQLCLDYMGKNSQQVNMLDNLIHLPVDLAADAILSMEVNQEDQGKFVQLAQSNILDIAVSCAIAYQCNDVALAYELAKKGSITKYAASVIVADFLKTDFITFLNDFDGVFDKAFPKEILDYGNYDCLYYDLICKGWNHDYIKQKTLTKTPLLSLKQMACFVYLQQNLCNQDIGSHGALCECILFEDIIGHQESMLIKILQNNLGTIDKASFPKGHSRCLNRRIYAIQCATILMDVLNAASKRLHMTKKEILIKLLIDGDPQLAIEFANIRDNFNDNMRAYFDEACNYFIPNIVRILERLDR